VEGLVSTPSAAFWAGKRVFLTGHTGFKGGWTSIWLSKLGAEVHGYALEAPTSPSLFQAARIGSVINSTIGDVRDLDALRRAMAAVKPDIVLHMAAQPLVRLSYRDPVETYATNVMGTVHLLEAVRSVGGVGAVVNVTTDKCYENREWPWGYRETEAMGGHDPYSSSKGCSELVTSAYRRSFFADGALVASARAGNVIGGGDWALDRLVPDILRAFGAGEPVVIRNPHAIRPWQHVLEPVSGYLTLAERLYGGDREAADAWNFGPVDADARPVGSIVTEMAALWGEGTDWRLDSGTNPHEAHYLKLDISKAKAALGWTPRWSLSQALTQTVAWHKAWLAGHDMQGVCRDQIHLYETSSNERSS
jgi:CDP-glucose 4,6-dehydratase